MTIGGYIGFGILALIIAVVVVAVCVDTFPEGQNPAVGIMSIALGLILVAALYFGMRWYFGSTESGKRALKTQESNFEGGIKRSVKVYDAIGNLLQEWEGTFDIDFDGDEQRILFDDENGKRHLVYFKTGTVIVEEVP